LIYNKYKNPDDAGREKTTKFRDMVFYSFIIKLELRREMLINKIRCDRVVGLELFCYWNESLNTSYILSIEEDEEAYSVETKSRLEVEEKEGVPNVTV
jgi:hypothetical protein